jgi:toxin ParE1/3/4
MAIKPLEIHPAALEELKSAVAWYLARRSETAAIKFINAIDEGMDLVLALPQRWPAGKYNTREFVLRRYPVAIVYRETETGVQALAIAHRRRRLGYCKGRR